MIFAQFMPAVQDVMSTPSLLHRISLLGLGSLATLAGCATSYAPSDELLGSTPSEVIAKLGEPFPRPESLQGIRRLEFPRGPYGRHTYFVYFNADGRAERFAQVLEEKNFDRIQRGMDQSEVIDLIGVARDTFSLARDTGYVWNYRYISPFCQWFQIEFTPEGKVRSTGYSKPPECKIKTVRFQR